MFKRNNLDNYENNTIENFQNSSKNSKSLVEGFFSLFQNKKSIKEGLDDSYKLPHGNYNVLIKFNISETENFEEILRLHSYHNPISNTELLTISADYSTTKHTYIYINPRKLSHYNYSRDRLAHLKNKYKEIEKKIQREKTNIRNDIFFIEIEKIFTKENINNLKQNFKHGYINKHTEDTNIKNLKESETSFDIKMWFDAFINLLDIIGNERELEEVKQKILFLEKIIDHPPGYFLFDRENYDNNDRLDRAVFHVNNGFVLTFQKSHSSDDKDDLWGTCEVIDLEYSENNVLQIVLFTFNVYNNNLLDHPYKVRIFTPAKNNPQILPGDTRHKATSIKMISNNDFNNDLDNNIMFPTSETATNPNTKTVISIPDLITFTQDDIIGINASIVDIYSPFINKIKKRKWESRDHILNKKIHPNSNISDDALIDLYVLFNQYTAKFSKFNIRNNTEDIFDSHFTNANLSVYQHSDTVRGLIHNTPNEVSDYSNKYPNNELLIEVASIQLPILFTNVLYVSKSGSLFTFTTYDMCTKNKECPNPKLIKKADEDSNNLSNKFRKEFRKYELYNYDFKFFNGKNVFQTHYLFEEFVKTTQLSSGYKFKFNGNSIDFDWNYSSLYIPKTKKEIFKIKNKNQLDLFYYLQNRYRTRSDGRCLIFELKPPSNNSCSFVNETYRGFGIYWNMSANSYSNDQIESYLPIINDQLGICCSCMGAKVRCLKDDPNRLNGMMHYKKQVTKIPIGNAVRECHDIAKAERSAYFALQYNNQCFVSTPGVDSQTIDNEILQLQSEGKYTDVDSMTHSDDLSAYNDTTKKSFCHQSDDSSSQPLGGPWVNALYPVNTSEKCNKYKTVRLVLDDEGSSATNNGSISFNNMSVRDTMTPNNDNTPSSGCSSQDHHIGLYMLLTDYSGGIYKKWIYDLTEKYNLSSDDLQSSSTFKGANGFPIPKNMESDNIINYIDSDDWLAMGETFISKNSKLLVYLDALGVLRINISLNPDNNARDNIQKIYRTKFDYSKNNICFLYQNRDSDREINSKETYGNIPNIITTRYDFENRLYLFYKINQQINIKDNKLNVYLVGKGNNREDTYFYLLNKNEYLKNKPSQYFYLNNTIIPPLKQIKTLGGNKDIVTNSRLGKTIEYPLNKYDYLKMCLKECDNNAKCALAEYSINSNNSTVCNLYEKSDNQEDNIFNYLIEIDSIQTKQKLFMKLPQANYDDKFFDNGYRTMPIPKEYIYENHDNVDGISKSDIYFAQNNIVKDSILTNNVITSLPIKETLTASSNGVSKQYLQYPGFSNIRNKQIREDAINYLKSHSSAQHSNKNLNRVNTTSSKYLDSTEKQVISTTANRMNITERFTNINDNYYDMNSNDFYQKILDDTKYIDNIFSNNNYTFKSNSNVDKLFINKDDMINTMLLVFILIVSIIIFSKICKK